MAEVINKIKTENGEIEQKVTMTTGNTLINVKSEGNSIASLQVDEKGAYTLSLGVDLKDAFGETITSKNFSIVADEKNPPITLKTGLQDELLVDVVLGENKKGKATINPTSVTITLDDGTTYYSTAEQGKGFDMDVSTKVVEGMYSKSNSFFTTPIILGVGKKAPNYLLGMYAEQTKEETSTVSDDIGIIKTNGMVFFTQKVKDGTSLYIYDDGVPKKIEGYFEGGQNIVLRTSTGNHFSAPSTDKTTNKPLFEGLSIKKFPSDLSFSAGYELSEYKFNLKPRNEKVKNKIPFKILRYRETGEIVYVNLNEHLLFQVDKDGKVWQRSSSAFENYQFWKEDEAVIGEAFAEKTKNGYFLIAEDKFGKIETEKDGTQTVTPISEEEYNETSQPAEQAETDKKTPTINPDEILAPESEPAENTEGIVSPETVNPTDEVNWEAEEAIAQTAETPTEEAEAPATISPEASETDKAKDEKIAPTEEAEKNTAENAQGVVADDKPQKPAKPKDLKKQVEAISSIAMTIGLFMILVGSLFAPWLALVGIGLTITSGLTNTFAGSFKYTPFDSVKQKVKAAEQAEREGRGRERDSNELVASNENVASKEIAKEFENNESQLDEMFNSAKDEQSELQKLSEQEGSTANMFANLCNEHGIDCPTLDAPERTIDAPERTMNFETLTDPNNLDGLAYRTELVSQIDDIARTTDPEQKAQLIDNFFSTNFKDVPDDEREKYTQMFNDNRGLGQIRNHLASFNEHQQNAQDLLKQQREFYTDKKHGTDRVLQTVSSLPKDEQVKFFERYGDAVAYTLSQNKNVTTTLNTLLSSVDKDNQDRVREILTKADKDLKHTINENVTAVAQRHHQNVRNIDAVKEYAELITLAQEAENEKEKEEERKAEKQKKEAEKAEKAVEKIEPSKIEQFNSKLNSFISSLPAEVQKQINEEGDIQKKLEIIGNQTTSINGKTTFAKIIEDNKNKNNGQLDPQKLQDELARTESVRVATEMLIAESHSTGIGNINDSNLRETLLEKNAILEGNTYEDVFDWIARKKEIERNEALKNYANLKKTYGNLSNSGMTQELFASLGLTDEDVQAFKNDQKNIKNLKLTESVSTFELTDAERDLIKDEVKNEVKNETDFINEFTKLMGKVDENGKITEGKIEEGEIKEGDFGEIKAFISATGMKNAEILRELGISTDFNDLKKKQELKNELFKLYNSKEYVDFSNEHYDKYNAVKEENRPYTLEITLLDIKKQKYQKKAENFKKLYDQFIKNPNKENGESLSDFLANVYNDDFLSISGISVNAIQRLIENPTLAKSFDENEHIIEQIDNAQKRFDSRYEFLDKLANASSQEEIDALNEERRVTLAKEGTKSFEEKIKAINNLKGNKENAMNAVLKYYGLISALNEIDNTQEVTPRKPEFGKIYSLPKEKDLISDEEALDKEVPTGLKSRDDQKKAREYWIDEVKKELEFYNFPMGSFDIETDRIFAGEFELSSEYLAKLVQMKAEKTDTIGLTGKKATKAKAKNDKREAKRNKKIEKGFNELTSYIAKRQKSKEKDLEKTQEELELSTKFKPSMRKTKIGLSVLGSALDGIEKQKQREQDIANKKKEAEEKAKETKKTKPEETKAKETEAKAKTQTNASKKKTETTKTTSTPASVNDGERE